MKRKSEGEEGPRKRGGNRTKKTKQESSDEEDDCAAVNCLRPSGKDYFLYISNVYSCDFLYISNVMMLSYKCFKHNNALNIILYYYIKIS